MFTMHRREEGLRGKRDGGEKARKRMHHQPQQKKITINIIIVAHI